MIDGAMQQAPQPARHACPELGGDIETSAITAEILGMRTKTGTPAIGAPELYFKRHCACVRAGVSKAAAARPTLVQWTFYGIQSDETRIMRGTKAIYAVERLKTRSGNSTYAALSLPGGVFRLVDRAGGIEQQVGEPMPLEAFVAFVDSLSPAKPKKASKLDAAFDAQIKRSRR